MKQKEKMEAVIPMTVSEKVECIDPDLPLIERIQKGDMTALEEVIQKYQKWVYSLAYRTVRNHADADDVAQETFIRLYRHIDKFQSKPGYQFAGWIYRITVNLSINQAKRSGREKKRMVNLATKESDEENFDPINNIPDKQNDANQEVMDKELQAKIEEVLETLSPEHRATFTLSEMQGYAYKEIAEIMQCPIGTVMSRLHYAKKILREKLKSYL